MLALVDAVSCTETLLSAELTRFLRVREAMAVGATGAPTVRGGGRTLVGSTQGTETQTRASERSRFPRT